MKVGQASSQRASRGIQFMKAKLLLGAGIAALIIPGVAAAQTTGSIQFEQGDVVVTGQRDSQVAGTKIPDSGKTKVELTQAFLAHETSGQSVLETINMLPGVSFTNNDPYGASGGTLSIRGFDASRISLTVDGVPLNDTGNYAIYSNQQVDPELIEQVNVVLGSTDIDSPSASASGSTVNYTTITPTDQFGARMSASVGDLNMFRVFGLVNTGVFTPWGTKAWFSASHQDYNIVYSNRGKIKKAQYNFKVYQPIGSNGDFIAVAGNYNVNRNNNVNDVYYDSFPTSKAARFASGFAAPCQTTTTTGQPGGAPTSGPGAQGATSCGSAYVESQNPSNTGTLRVTSTFHLADRLVLNVDPTFWYTKANGGSGTITAKEGFGPGGVLGTVTTINPVTKAATTNYYLGEDLNGDGDDLDTVRIYAPSMTVTHRYIINSSLRYDLSDTQTLRLSYTHDYGRHRQTAEGAYLQVNGQTAEPFPVNNPLLDGNGNVFQKRDRKSFAVLDQVSAEYRGEFLDDKLVISAGARAPWFKRNLHQNCFTLSAAGGVTCLDGDADAIAAYAAANPYLYNSTTGVVTGAAAPQERKFTYNRVLPSFNFTYKFGGHFTTYGSYSRGIQVPGTDNLYNSMYTPQGVQQPVPEISDNFDAGLRYTSSKIQAEVGPWLTLFKDRLASAYDPITDLTIYRNLGAVHKYGVDGSIAYKPVQQLTLYAFGSYLWSDILHNVQTGDGTFALTEGKRESGVPVYTFGGRAEVNINPVEFGIEAKRTGRRYLNDQNVDLLSKYCPNNGNCGAYAPGYTVVNLDARLSLGFLGLNDKTYLQLNVTNLFDSLYIGSFGGGLPATNDPFSYIAPPRTFSGTINVAF
jgi:iron complex outermembrane recepter protein